MSDIDLGSDFLNFIIQAGYRPGDRLPTISELADEANLNISPSKVREQLEVARALGIVEVRSKTGTRLKEYSFTPAVRLSLLYALASDMGRFEMFSALRNHVEVAFWHEACALLSADDHETMRRCIVAAHDKLLSHPIRIPNQEHRLFHLTVFRRLENPFVIGLLEAYWDAYEAVEANRYADYDYLRAVWDYHQRILDAIVNGDFDAAQTAFVEHTQLLRYTPKTKGMKRITTAQE